MMILSAGFRYRRLSETRVAVCLIPGTVFVLIGRQSRRGPRHRHPRHIGGRRVAGGVPRMNPVGVDRARLDGPVAEGCDMRPHPANLREQTGRTDTVHRTNTGARIGQTTIDISDIGRCPQRGDGITVVISTSRPTFPFGRRQCQKALARLQIIRSWGPFLVQRV